VPILGPGGVGKTTVSVAALHDQRVVQRFGVRRWFVRCEGTKSREALIGEIATGIGLEPGGHLEERAFRELEREPAVLVLDNAETPWEGDLEKVEELLAGLAGLPGLALVASIRGDERPLGPAWAEAIRVLPLSLPDARQAFLAVAGERFQSDSLLERLLEAVDRLPLAVTLLAYQAQADPNLSGLWARWQKKRTAVLSRGAGRLLSLDVSLEISIQSPRMTEEARRLLSLLGLLPDGIAEEDFDVLLPDHGYAAAHTLRGVGLASTLNGRIRVLAPVREHVARRDPPDAEDLERAQEHYLELAALGENVGRENGVEAVRRLAPETGNLEALTLSCLAGPEAMGAMKAVLGLGRLYQWTGLGTSACLMPALKCARNAGDARQAADCLQRLGDIDLHRSDYDAARARYEEALPLYQCVGHVLGEANCIWRLGDIDLRRSDHDAARDHYHAALPLYRRLRHRLGEANCIKNLGDIDLRRSDLDAARVRYEEALLVYRRVGDALGEANCILNLGTIDLARSNYDDARARFEEALPLYRGVGSVLGEANYIKILGEFDVDRSDHDAACARYEEALQLYRRVGEVLGEAHCILSLGDIDKVGGDLASARARFGEALGLYSRISEPFSIGWAHVRLARIEGDPETKEHHVVAAREAWTRIKRPDLVDDLKKEFGNEFPGAFEAPEGSSILPGRNDGP
jgi:tetratricopeptide (TPR) repeat protein